MDKSNYMFIVPGLGFGGLEMQTIFRISDAINLGNEAILICEKKSRTEEFALSNNLPVYSLKQNMKYFDLLYSKKLAKIISKKNIEICIVSSTQSLSQVILAKKFARSNTKIILYQHMQSGINKKDIFHDWVYRNIQAAIVITERMKLELSQTTNFNQDLINVIPPGIKTEDFASKNFNKNECRKLFGLPENKIIIGSVGRFDIHKDQLTSIKALSRIENENIILVFAGNKELQYIDYFNNLLNLIKELRLEKRIFIILNPGKSFNTC